ncbi:MAG TPA: aminotransferase class III-fold pyridoxal phosphate-dependent enzyme [Acidisphaera sp.]|nr:aminotransferase class III-fold pyridoxal phosphate-dependent enzyme [Acidisphaera sp.]HME20049.1 aminotransferase class III-fold pyridoxal phosphate-dependent enzyme [Acetobacteraceae bacterium]
MSIALHNASVDAVLAEAREAFVTANPRSLARHVEATAVMPGGNTRTILHFAPFPMAIERAEGCRLWSADGGAYVDFLGEYTAGLYGHAHPVIRAAIDAALDRGIGYGGVNMTEARFAAAVAGRFPAMERLRFTNSGTEANVMAIATACAATRRRRVMVFDGGYHGGVLGFAGGGSAINVPYDWVAAPYNDEAAATALIEQHATDLAAVIVEPMMGSAGCIPATAAFLTALRAATERVGALLICDEVMTSRLSLHGLAATLDVRPDLMSLGKYVGGGMSFGAFGGRADIMSLFDPRRPDALRHAGTFNNNVLTMSAGLAGLTQVLTPQALEALNARGEALRLRLNALCERAGAALQFTGCGSMLAPHFVRGPVRCAADAARSDPKLIELLFFDLLARGIWIARRGMMALSLPIGDAECDALADAVAAFLEARGPLLARTEAGA